MTTADRKRLAPLTDDDDTRLLSTKQPDGSWHAPKGGYFPNASVTFEREDINFNVKVDNDDLTNIIVTANYIALHVFDSPEVKKGLAGDPGGRFLVTLRGIPDGGSASVLLDNDTAVWLAEALSEGLAKRRESSV
jgi:hypothetical protein